MRFFKLLAIVLFATLFLGCSNDNQNDGPAPLIKPYEEGEKITLQNIHGGIKTLVRTKDGFVVKGDEEKVLMLDIFGTFCRPCQDEAPHLTDLQLRKHDNFIILGLTHLEDVSSEYVLENFAQKFGAYYFIANQEENARIAETITQDIGYKQALQVPFKVMLKNGNYQTVVDVWEGRSDRRYYIGKIDTALIEKDLLRILDKK
ncbi:MAG: TlpA family protein disulfide reductase [Campylobacteraceae bacterium]|nr:TlpA family protein disulfide reductase [Campylobacteraceae bacterium]